MIAGSHLPVGEKTRVESDNPATNACREIFTGTAVSGGLHSHSPPQLRKAKFEGFCDFGTCRHSGKSTSGKHLRRKFPPYMEHSAQITRSTLGSGVASSLDARRIPPRARP
jgi:hypothetical protein